MRADVDHLRLSVERQPDHYAIAVLNGISGACLFCGECTNAQAGTKVVLDFASWKLGRSICEEDVAWTNEPAEPGKNNSRTDAAGGTRDEQATEARPPLSNTHAPHRPAPMRRTP